MPLAASDHLYGDRMQPDIEAWGPWHPPDFAARMRFGLPVVRRGWVPQGERKLARMSSETLAAEFHETWAYERAAPAQRAWLHTALERVHPGREWISATSRPYR